MAAAALVVVWFAYQPGPDTMLARVVGVGLPLVAIGALFLIRAEE